MDGAFPANLNVKTDGGKFTWHKAQSRETPTQLRSMPPTPVPALHLTATVPNSGSSSVYGTSASPGDIMGGGGQMDQTAMDPILPNVSIENEEGDGDDVPSPFMMSMISLTSSPTSMLPTPTPNSHANNVSSMQLVCDESAVYQRIYSNDNVPASHAAQVLPCMIDKNSDGEYDADGSNFEYVYCLMLDYLSHRSPDALRMSLTSPREDDDDEAFATRKNNTVFAKKFDELKQIVEKFGCMTRNRTETVDAARSIIAHLEGTVLMFHKELESRRARQNAQRMRENEVNAEMNTPPHHDTMGMMNIPNDISDALSPLYEYDDRFHDLNEYTPSR